MVKRFVTQFDGCTYCSGGLNCTAASHAMWLFRASQGKIVTSACAVRRQTGDRTGGTNLRQMHAVSVARGVTKGTLWLPGSFTSLRSLAITGRYGMHLNVGYNVLANTRWDCFAGTFRGAHDIFVTGGDQNTAEIGDPGANGRRASIPNGWQRIPWDLLSRAASVLPLSSNGPTLGQEYGSGRVFAYITPADPIVVLQKYRVLIRGYTNLYSSPTGPRVGAVTRASYICTRSKVGGLWWYRIVSTLDGTTTANRGRYFKPHSKMEAFPV